MGSRAGSPPGAWTETWGTVALAAVLALAGLLVVGSLWLGFLSDSEVCGGPGRRTPCQASAPWVWPVTVFLALAAPVAPVLLLGVTLSRRSTRAADLRLARATSWLAATPAGLLCLLATVPAAWSDLPGTLTGGRAILIGVGGTLVAVLPLAVGAQRPALFVVASLLAVSIAVVIGFRTVLLAPLLGLYAAVVLLAVVAAVSAAAGDRPAGNDAVDERRDAARGQ